ncbi:MAG: TolC family protein [Marinilabiliaceae bacterium]|nr:TolC family protein [Marinilabiliaceae bacterium]
MKNLLPMIVLLAFGLSNVISAQDNQDAISLSLNQAIDYAMENAYSKISAEYDVEAAQKQKWETIAMGLPQVDGSAGYNHSLDLPVSLLPVEILPPDNWPDGAKPGDKVPVSFATAYDANFKIAISQLIFDGSYLVGLKASKVFLKLTEEQKEKAEIEIRTMVFQAYYIAITAQENVATFERSLEVNKKTLAETQAYYDNGFREEMDVAQVELMVSNGESRLLEVKRSYDVAMAALKYSIGMDFEQHIQLSDNMETLIESAAIYNTTNTEFDLSTNIDFRLAESSEESQRLFMKNEQSQYLPKIYGSYSYNKSVYGDDVNVFGQEWYPSQFVGVNITMPIFTSGKRSAKVKQEKLKYLKAQNEKVMVSENLKKEFLTAKTNLATTREQYTNSLKNKNLANRIYEVTLTKFNNGLAGSTELSQNEGQYVDAEVGYVQAVLRMLQAHIEYQKVISKL